MSQKVHDRKLIQKIKSALAKEPIFIEKCKEYNKSPHIAYDIPISFDELDVSAKTVDGKIFLNRKLLDEGWHDQFRYALHEACHVLQQDAGLVDGKTKQEDYLDDPNEQEAFQAQIDYMEEHTPEEVDQYLDQLLDHHDIKGKERQEKIRTLLDE